MAGFQGVKDEISGEIIDVNIVGGATIATTYTEGDTDASITGIAFMWEDTGDTLRAVSAAKPLPVDLQDASVVVTATSLDIRDLVAASDAVTIHGDVGVFDQFDLTNSNPAVVAIVDANGDQITSFGGGTQYIEDDAAAANPVGNALILVREDARAGTLTSTDGDNVAARGNNKGELYVIDTDAVAMLTTIDGRVDGIEALLGTINTAVGNIDTDATTIIGHLDGVEGLLTTIDADTGAIATSVANIDTDTTTIIGHLDGVEGLLGTIDADTGSILLAVDGIEGLLTTIDADTGSILAAVDGLETSNSAIQTAVELIDNAIGVEDAAETLGGGLMMAGSVRRDTAASSAGTTGDNATINTDSLGRLWISGAAVEDAAETAGGILLMMGAVRRDTAASSSGTTGDNSTLNTDAVGKLWVTGTVLEDAAHSAGEQLTPNGVRRIDTPATSAGTSGDWSTMDASAEGALWTTNTPTTTGGCLIFRTIDIDETEEEVKATAGNVYGYYFYNASTSVRYLKFYNATAASVAVGTTTPVLTFPLPASTAGHISFGFPVGFSTAICVAATTGLADADTGAPSANDVILNVFYK